MKVIIELTDTGWTVSNDNNEEGSGQIFVKWDEVMSHLEELRNINMI